MIDLFCLVADKNMEAAVTSILKRPGSLQVDPIQFEIAVHPRRDPGCYFESAEILKGRRHTAKNAIVLLDRAWDGAPEVSGEKMERTIEASLAEKGLSPWARVVVIDPELEVWVFSDSPHLAEILGWAESSQLRKELAKRELWLESEKKPRDPKAALEWMLWNRKKPRSSAIYRELATRVGFQRCQDRSFLRFREILVDFHRRGAAEKPDNLPQAR